MYVQETRLDVGAEVHAGREELARALARLRELGTVPREDAALVADRRVAAREMERATRYRVAATLVEEATQLHGGVGRVGVAHGRARVRERPPRHHGRAAGEPREAAHDVAHLRTADKVHVEIAMLGHEVPVRSMVVVNLAAEIKGTIGQCIVEQAECPTT